MVLSVSETPGETARADSGALKSDKLNLLCWRPWRRAVSGFSLTGLAWKAVKITPKRQISKNRLLLNSRENCFNRASYKCRFLLPISGRLEVSAGGQLDIFKCFLYYSWAVFLNNSRIGLEEATSMGAATYPAMKFIFAWMFIERSRLKRDYQELCWSWSLWKQESGTGSRRALWGAARGPGVSQALASLNPLN